MNVSTPYNVTHINARVLAKPAPSVNPVGAEVVAAPEHDLPFARYNSIGAAVTAGRARLKSERLSAGNWCYEFEADCTIPAEFLLLVHFTGVRTCHHSTFLRGSCQFLANHRSQGAARAAESANPARGVALGLL